MKMTSERQTFNPYYLSRGSSTPDLLEDVVEEDVVLAREVGLRGGLGGHPAQTTLPHFGEKVSAPS